MCEHDHRGDRDASGICRPCLSPHFSNYLCAPLFTISICFFIFSARVPARVFIQPGAGCLVGI